MQYLFCTPDYTTCHQYLLFHNIKNIFWLVEMLRARMFDINIYVSKATRRHALANSILYLQVVVRQRYIFQKCDKS